MYSALSLDRNRQRDMLLVWLGLAVVITLSWAYLLTGAGTMQDMGGMTMAMSIWPWTITHAVLMFFMWVVMMTAMMLPSATPAILLYGHIYRRGNIGGFVATVVFAMGYLAIWAGFSLIAVLTQFLLEWTGFMSSMMEATSTRLSGAILLAAGLYQVTPLKYACLRACRSPLDFLMLHWHAGKKGALKMGLWHGAYCVACCWALMLLLFVGGVMNFGWIIGIAIYVLVEKLVPGGFRIARVGGGLADYGRDFPSHHFSPLKLIIFARTKYD